MVLIKVKGQIIAGEFGRLVMRQKADQDVEIGELLVAEFGDEKILLQAYDLLYGSQISQQNLELIAGMQLEDEVKADFMDPQLRNYTLAMLKNLITLRKKGAAVSKSLPAFFSTVREVEKDDLSFLTPPRNPLPIGTFRSGSKALPVPVILPGDKVLSHHILIAS